MSFKYILEKIKKAEFETDPFKHLLIRNFFSDKHFDEITKDPQVKRPVANTTRELINDLTASGYKIQPFAGSIMSIDDYIDYLEDKSKFNRNLLRGQGTKILSGYGMTMRMDKIRSPLLEDLSVFLNSDEFVSCLTEKFDITGDLRVETAYQKNLTGYNLSPHPDMRDKALTYMANIYTEKDSSARNFHTHFLKFKPEFQYIAEFWKHNTDVETCWVPWDWCETVSLTSENNAISIFKPSYDTLHAVNVDYDHLTEQRNQVYGNLWYKNPAVVLDSKHTKLNLKSSHTEKSVRSSPLKAAAKRVLASVGLRKS